MSIAPCITMGNRILKARLIEHIKTEKGKISSTEKVHVIERSLGHELTTVSD